MDQDVKNGVAHFEQRASKRVCCCSMTGLYDFLLLSLLLHLLGVVGFLFTW